MSTLYRMFVLFILMVLMISCTAPATPQPTPTEPPDATSIVRHPAPDDYSGYNVHTEPPKFNPKSEEQWQVDLRSSDLTKLDLSQSQEALLHANFDSKTKWPTADKMPADFDWQQIMELGKDPGLGIRALQWRRSTSAPPWASASAAAPPSAMAQKRW